MTSTRIAIALIAACLAACGGGSGSGSAPQPPPVQPTTYTIGGTLTGLPLGQSIQLQNSGGNDLALSANGNFTFSSNVAAGSTYNVTIRTQPTGATCTAQGATGTAQSNVTSVTITCVVQAAAAPADACTDRQTLRRYGETTPPNYSAILAWANAMTSTSTAPATARVEVDYIRLLQADSPSSATVLISAASEEYLTNRGALTTGEGALFARTPRCQPGASSTPISTSSVSGGVLTIELATIPNRYAHWWTSRGPLTAGKRYFIESRFRVTGAAFIQFGVDYWRNANVDYNFYDETCLASNNCEAWVSDWYGDTGGQFVVKKVPVL